MANFRPLLFDYRGQSNSIFKTKRNKFDSYLSRLWIRLTWNEQTLSPFRLIRRRHNILTEAPLANNHLFERGRVVVVVVGRRRRHSVTFWGRKQAM